VPSKASRSEIVGMPAYLPSPVPAGDVDWFAAFLIPSFVPVVVIVLAAGAFAVRIQHKRRRAVPVCPGEASAGEDTHGTCSVADLIGTLFCPVCGSEFLKTAPSCEDCGVDLVEENDLPEVELRIEQAVIRVARVMRSCDAHLIRDYLDLNRVPSAITRWGFAGADVHVFESDALRARRLIGHCLPSA
jgi:hypothetical protein